MLPTRLVHAALVGSLALAALACGGNGPSATPTPGGAAAQPAPATPLPLALPTNSVQGAGAAYSSVAGVYTLAIDLSQTNPTAALEPVRLGQAAGDAYAVDVTGFLTESPCSGC
ncbi:MAG TPA: hypothetical protein VEI97_02310, partial [bacterium]|nr:hypothetical protein [bacterium]